MSTEAQRKASAAFHVKREAEGLKKVTLWLSPQARFKLDAFKAVAGSKDKAADAAILAWSGPGPGPGPVINHMTAVRAIVERAALAETSALSAKTFAKDLAAISTVQFGRTPIKPGQLSKKPKAGK